MEPFEPLISNVSEFLRPSAKREASIVPMAPCSNSTIDSKASSTVDLAIRAAGMKVLVAPLTVSISPTR